MRGTGAIGQAISEWHDWLRGTEPDKDGAGTRKANAAALAELRRCTDAREVMMTWPFGRLVRRAFPQTERDGVTDDLRHDIEALAHTALIMSRAKEAGGVALPNRGRVPRLMAEVPEGGQHPAVGRVLANVLLSAPDAEEACRSLLSILPLLGGGEPVLDPVQLYRAMRWWDRVRVDWAMDYHVALPADEKAGPS